MDQALKSLMAAEEEVVGWALMPSLPLSALRTLLASVSSLPLQLSVLPSFLPLQTCCCRTWF